MSAVYDERCPSYETVKGWKGEFKCGHTRIQDDPIEGYPLAPTEPNLVAKTEELLLEDK